MFRHLWRDEKGQDLIEYGLLLAFLSLTTAALVIDPATNLNFIWITDNGQLSVAASAVTAR